MGRVVGLRHGLGQLLVLATALQVCALVAPFYLQWMVDEALVAADRDLVAGARALGFLLLAAMQAAMTTVRSWVTTTLATHLNFQWLGNAFAHLMKLPSTTSRSATWATSCRASECDPGHPAQR